MTRVQLNKLHHVSLQCYIPFLFGYGAASNRNPLHFSLYLPCAANKSERLSIILFMENTRWLSRIFVSRSLQRLRTIPCDLNVSAPDHSLLLFGCSLSSLHFSEYMKQWCLKWNILILLRLNVVFGDSGTPHIVLWSFYLTF